MSSPPPSLPQPELPQPELPQPELPHGFCCSPPQFGRPELQKILNGGTAHHILPKTLINREEPSALQL
jgi:hypothetical protein